MCVAPAFSDVMAGSHPNNSIHQAAPCFPHRNSAEGRSKEQHVGTAMFRKCLSPPPHRLSSIWGKFQIPWTNRSQHVLHIPLYFIKSCFILLHP